MSITVGPINPIFIPEENYSICSRCRHEIMTLADGSAYCSCNERELHERYAEPSTCATCGGKGKYWIMSGTRHVLVRCLACTPAPVDPWKFHN
jgi:hypothetical protein